MPGIRDERRAFSCLSHRACRTKQNFIGRDAVLKKKEEGLLADLKVIRGEKAGIEKENQEVDLIKNRKKIKKKEVEAIKNKKKKNL